MGKRPLFVKPLEIEVQSEYPPFFSMVVDGKLAGSGQLSKYALREQIEMLRDKENVKGVVSLTRYGVEPEVLEEEGVAYLHLPTVDKCPLTIKDLFRGCGFVDSINARGGAVLVHCREGIGRTGTMIAGWMIISLRMPAKEAIADIRAKRANSVHQHHQELRLWQLERVVQCPKSLAQAQGGAYDESHLDFGYIKAHSAALIVRMNDTHLLAAYFHKLMAFNVDQKAARLGQSADFSIRSSTALPKYLHAERSPLWKPKLNGFRSLITGAAAPAADAPPEDAEGCGTPMAESPPPYSPSPTAGCGGLLGAVLGSPTREDAAASPRSRKRSATHASPRAANIASPGLLSAGAAQNEAVPPTPSSINRKMRANSGMLLKEGQEHGERAAVPPFARPVRGASTSSFLAPHDSEDAVTALSDDSRLSASATANATATTAASVPSPPCHASARDSIDSFEGSPAGAVKGRKRLQLAGVGSPVKLGGSTSRRGKAPSGGSDGPPLVPRPPGGGGEEEDAPAPLDADPGSPRGAAGRARGKLLCPTSPGKERLGGVSPRDALLMGCEEKKKDGARVGSPGRSPRPPGGERPTSGRKVGAATPVASFDDDGPQRASMGDGCEPVLAAPKRSMPPIVGKRTMSPLLPRDMSPGLQALSGSGLGSPPPATSPPSDAVRRAPYHHERETSPQSPTLYGRRSSRQHQTGDGSVGNDSLASLPARGSPLPPGDAKPGLKTSTSLSALYPATDSAAARKTRGSRHSEKPDPRASDDEILCERDRARPARGRGSVAKDEKMPATRSLGSSTSDPDPPAGGVRRPTPPLLSDRPPVPAPCLGETDRQPSLQSVSTYTASLEGKGEPLPGLGRRGSSKHKRTTSDKSLKPFQPQQTPRETYQRNRTSVGGV
eukprot:TRINITY_DN4293_c0_g2_i1.p1 TRINITY_DN4293_c0_g2~~TRINITY_DN4293_c0_g2_i1.p1  ORF type:complete len:894 (+),score=282.68 TRINITY_DN4293_c0_g2_i1:193-2874(+)